MQDLWDMFHPADADEDIADEFDEVVDCIDLDAAPQIPTIDKLPDVVDYSARGPNDYVLGGPLGEGRGNGRHFDSLEDAYKWAAGKFGRARVQLIPQESEYRWALLIKAA